MNIKYLLQVSSVHLHFLKSIDNCPRKEYATLIGYSQSNKNIQITRKLTFNDLAHNILNLLLTFIYIAPYYLYLVVPGRVYRNIMLVCSGLMMLLYLSNKRARRYGKLRTRVMLFSVVMLGITIIKSGDVIDCIYKIIEMFTLIFYVSMISGKWQKIGLRLLSLYYLCLALINDAILLYLKGSIFVGTDVNNQMNFLGTDNYIGTFLIPGMMITLYYMIKYNSLTRTKFIVCCLVYAFSVFYVNTATSIVAISACVILFLLLYKNNSEIANVVTYVRMLIGVFVAFVLITIFNSGIFNAFIVNVLGKTISFTGRSVLWKLSLAKFIHSPVFGYGYGNQAFDGIRFNSMASNMNSTPHSGYLTILLYGGIVLLIAFIIVLLSDVKGINKAWNFKLEVRVLSIGVVGLMIYFLAEWRFYIQGLWILLMLLEIEVLEWGKKQL